MSNADHPEAVVVGRDQAPRKRGGAFSLVPGFFYILILYIIGKYVFADPRATLFDFLGYKLSWVEVLLVAAAIMAMVEQIKVAKPGINNTTEVLLMGLIAIIQVLLFALGAAKVPALAIFDNTEFLLLTLINLAQTAVAYQINSATLMRTISAGVVGGPLANFFVKSLTHKTFAVFPSGQIPVSAFGGKADMGWCTAYVCF